MIDKCPSGSSFGRRSDARSDLDDDPHTAPGERHRAALGPGIRHHQLFDVGSGEARYASIILQRS